MAPRRGLRRSRRTCSLGAGSAAARDRLRHGTGRRCPWPSVASRSSPSSWARTSRSSRGASSPPFLMSRSSHPRSRSGTPAGELFDAVVSFNAFHWLDPDVRFTKSASVLRPGGSLGVFGSRFVGARKCGRHVARGLEDERRSTAALEPRHVKDVRRPLERLHGAAGTSAPSSREDVSPGISRTARTSTSRCSRRCRRIARSRTTCATSCSSAQAAGSRRAAARSVPHGPTCCTSLQPPELDAGRRSQPGVVDLERRVLESEALA